MNCLGILLLLLISASLPVSASVSELPAKVFESLNLDYPGLEKVKAHVAKGAYALASDELLNYYKNRDIKHPEYNQEDRSAYRGRVLPQDVLEKAEKGMLHHFFVHKGYGFLDYGQDINWQYWPVKDNEIRWQVNRMYWWVPMGLAYWSTDNEKFAEEWIFQYRDWIKKNPPGLSQQNDRFAWRALETSHRLQEQTALFNLFISSPHFSPQFLLEFLGNYRRHAEHLLTSYAEKGNHLLFEAQRIIYAGCFFPEFKRAEVWRRSGIDILNAEIGKQVYPDGLQYEFSPNYHTGAINTFLKAYRMAQLAHLEQEFPPRYKAIIEKMIMAQIIFSFPDYSYPMFSDAKLENKENMLKAFRSWQEVFPDNPVIAYFATERKNGQAPPFLSNALKDGGFYTFRNSWSDTATVMVLKASPPAFWHSQPDNGTFDLWVNGRNFMPDAGAYVYGGDAEVLKLRNWYRQTMVHKTLTLNNANMDTCDAQLLLWKTSDQLDILTYTNPSYSDLHHTRTVLFINKKYFIIFDKAAGNAKGEIAVHFQLKEGKAIFHERKNSVQTDFDDGNNLLIRNFDVGRAALVKEEGKVSYAYRKEVSRPAFSFRKVKRGAEGTGFVTVLYPFEGRLPPEITVSENRNNMPEKGVIDITVVINGKKQLIRERFE